MEVGWVIGWKGVLLGTGGGERGVNKERVRAGIGVEQWDACYRARLCLGDAGEDGGFDVGPIGWYRSGE